MSHLRRRSNVYNLVNPTVVETLDSIRRRPLHSTEYVQTSSKSAKPMLPQIDTPDKCQTILGCIDNHPKEVHNKQPIREQRTYLPQKLDLSMTSQQRIDASQYPSPDSEFPADINKTAMRNSGSGTSTSGGEPSSCNSSNTYGSFSNWIHTCKTGPNALDRNTSASQASSSRQSSDSRDWLGFGPWNNRAVSQSNLSSGWTESISCQRSHLISGPSDESRKHSQKESLAALTLTEMSGGAGHDDANARSAGSGDENYSPTDIRGKSKGKASNYYKDGFVASMRSSVKQDYPSYSTSSQKQLDAMQPTFTNPFSPAPSDSAQHFQTNLAHLTLPPIISRECADVNRASVPSVLGKRYRGGTNEDTDGMDSYSRLTSAQLIHHFTNASDNLRYGPIQSEYRPSYGPIQNNGVQEPSGSIPSAIRTEAATDNFSEASASASMRPEPQMPREVAGSNSEPEVSGSRQPRTDRTFTCVFQGPSCDTNGNNSRKAFSDFFGRNKNCTMQIPKQAWNFYCRQHYQRVKYRYQKEDRYFALKASSIFSQIDTFERFMGAEGFPEHGPIVWTIGYQKSLRQEVTEALGRVARGRPALLQSEDDKVQKLMGEVNIALHMDDRCGQGKTSDDCKEFLKEMTTRCIEENLSELIRVEFLPVRWGGKDRMKAIQPH